MKNKGLLALCVMMGFLVSAAQAENYDWFQTGGTNDFVGQPVKWEKSDRYWYYFTSYSAYAQGIPGEQDNAYIEATNTYMPAVSGSNAITIQNLIVDGMNTSGTKSASVTSVNIFNSGHFTTTGSQSLIFGNTSNAEVMVQSRGVWNNKGNLSLGGRVVPIDDKHSYSVYGWLYLSGTAIYTGKNVDVGNYGEVYINNASQMQLSGSLLVNGGYVSAYNQSSVSTGGIHLLDGSITVSGTSQWNNNGVLNSNSSLQVSDGASFTNSGSIIMEGTIVKGASLFLNSSASFVGGSGTTVIAASDESPVFVDVQKGSSFKLNGDLNAASGAYSNFQLNVNDSSSATMGNATLASGNNAQTTITLDSNSQVNTKNLTAASGQDSNVTIVVGKNSALNSTNADLASGVNSTVGISVSGSGATWNNSGNVSFATNGMADLRAEDGGQVNVGGVMQVAPNATSVALIEIGPRGRLNVNELALGPGVISSGSYGSGLVLNGNNSIGKITGGKAIDVTITGTTAFNGNSDYVGSTTVAFRAMAVLNNANSQLGNGDLFNQGSIRFGKGDGLSTLTVNGNYIGDNGTIYLTSNLNGSSATVDRLIIAGDAKGTTMLSLNEVGKKGGPTPGNGIEVVSVGGSSDANAFQLNNGRPIYSGMYMYTFQQTGQNWYLTGQKNMETGGAILNTAGATSITWFTQLDSLSKRMGEMRYQTEQSVQDYIEHGKRENPHSVDFWVRTYGRQADVNLGITGISGFTDYLYGIDVGADKSWNIDEKNSLLVGYFIGYGGDQRDFKTNGSKGSTDSYYTGFYGSWINKDGWYADLVTKGQYFSNSYDAYGDNYFSDHGSYDNWGAGASLEIGKRFDFNRGFFVEPSAQVAYMRLFNSSYTSDVTYVDAKDADILRFWGGLRAGWSFKVNDSGSVLQPYLKGGVIEQISSGGQVQVGGDPEDVWRPNSDGLYYVGGIGLMYQITDVDQMHLDYEATFGDKYNVPWNINLGYRHQF